jgi:hypothetical protein
MWPPNFQKIRNCKVLEVPLPGFRNAISGFYPIRNNEPLGFELQRLELLLGENLSGNWRYRKDQRFFKKVNRAELKA